MPQKLSVSIKNFMLTGEFGGIIIGQTKSEIESFGFPPEDWATPQGNETKDNSPIWVYGYFDFHFDQVNRLIQISTNYVSDARLKQASIIEVEDWWLIPPGNLKVGLIRAISELNTMGIDFRKKYKKPSFIDIELENGVFMSFDHPEDEPHADHDTWKMSVIGIRKTN